MDIAIDRARREHVWMVRREVDVRNGPAVALERVLDGPGSGIISLIEIPH